MTQVPVTLTEPRSRSKVKFKFSPKWVKNQRTGHILEAISPTHFIFGTKVQPNKAHSMTHLGIALLLAISLPLVRPTLFHKKLVVKYPIQSQTYCQSKAFFTSFEFVQSELHIFSLHSIFFLDFPYLYSNLQLFPVLTFDSCSSLEDKTQI